METTREDIRAFQEAYEADFGETITDEEARELLTRLVVFYERLAEPLPRSPMVSYD